MAKRINYPKPNRYRRNCVQKLLIEKHFPSFRCRVYPNRLICVGKINPDPEGIDSTEYKFQITYAGIPEVRILSPKLQLSSKVHVYRDETLCLYYPEDSRWTDRTNIHETIIPWTAEWLVLYERYLHSGIWEGPEAPHNP